MLKLMSKFDSLIFKVLNKKKLKKNAENTDNKVTASIGSPPVAIK